MSKTAKRLGRGLDSLVSNLRGEVMPTIQKEKQGDVASVPAAPGPIQSSPPGTVSEPVFHVKQGIGPATKAGSFINLPVDVLVPNPYQPRSKIDDSGLSALVASIRKSGILQPITVRIRDGRHEIIAGERRWTAAKSCGLSTVPVIVRDADDEQMLELALIENIQREDLNPIDRAKAYKRFCTRFSLRAEDLADRLGEDRSTVSNYLRIIELSQSIQDLIAAGRLGMGQGRSLLGISDVRQREELARRAADGEWSVRTLEDVVRKEKQAARVKTVDGAAAKLSPHVRDLQQRFEHSLKTKVTIVEGRRKGSGRITIEYYSLDDFDRIAGALGVATD